MPNNGRGPQLPADHAVPACRVSAALATQRRWPRRQTVRPERRLAPSGSPAGRARPIAAKRCSSAVNPGTGWTSSSPRISAPERRSRPAAPAPGFPRRGAPRPGRGCAFSRSGSASVATRAASTASAYDPGGERPAQRLDHVQHPLAQPLPDGDHPVVVPAGQQFEVLPREPGQRQAAGLRLAADHPVGPSGQQVGIDDDVVSDGERPLVGAQHIDPGPVQPPEGRAQDPGRVAVTAIGPQCSGRVRACHPPRGAARRR